MEINARTTHENGKWLICSYEVPGLYLSADTALDIEQLAQAEIFKIIGLTPDDYTLNINFVYADDWNPQIPDHMVEI